MSALLWKIIPAFQDHIALPLVFSVLIQEAMRFTLVKGYSRAEHSIAKVAGVAVLPFNDLSSSLAAGLGFGAMYALIMYGGVLATSQEPADYFTEACPRTSLFVVSAFDALFFQVLHIALMVMTFDALRRHSTASWRASRFGLVVALHLVASLVTLINSNGAMGGCAASVPLLLVVTCCAVGVAITTVRSVDYFTGEYTEERQREGALQLEQTRAF